MTDTFGQSASTMVSDISIDLTPPSLSGVAASAPNGAGWYSAPVSMAWTCEDALSGIEPSIARRHRRPSARAHRCRCQNGGRCAGNVASVSSEAVAWT
ncbi:MAG: hypothetical protein R2711_18470 [Acidimicrobiales bacterium]